MMVGQIFTSQESIKIFLYRNNHDGTFTDVTEKAGVSGVNSAGKKYSLSRLRGLITTMMVVSIYSSRTILTGLLRHQRSVVCRQTPIMPAISLSR